MSETKQQTLDGLIWRQSEKSKEKSGTAQNQRASYQYPITVDIINQGKITPINP